MRKIVQSLICAVVILSGCSEAAMEEKASANYETNASYEEDYGYTETEEALAYEEYEKSEMDSEPVPVQEDVPAIQYNRKIIKEGDLTYQVDSIELTRKKVVESVQKYGGYIVHDNADYYGEEKSYYFEIKVPAGYFDSFIDELTSGVNKFDVKTITATDVTEEFVDLEARLKAKKEVEQRFIQLLAQANSIEEVLNVEQEVGYLRTEIESIEGRLNYLKNRTGLSTLRLSVYESSPYIEVEEEGYGSKFGNAFEAGWIGIVYFFIGLTALWPFILLTIIIIVVVKVLMKKSRIKKQKSKA